MLTKNAEVQATHGVHVSDLSKYLFGCDKPFKVHSPRGKIMVGCTKKNPCARCADRMKGILTGHAVAEMQLHTASSFVTLTYNDENLPSDLREAYKDVQLWFKTMRNRQEDTLQFADGRQYTGSIPSRFRYLVAAEFGPLQGS